MIAYEQMEYEPSFEAATHLLIASDAENYVRYEAKNGKTLKYLPFLAPNCSLYPVESLLGEEYSLSEFGRLSDNLHKATGLDCYEHLLKLWTFAYYTGWGGFSSRDVFLSTDGVNFSLPSLFNYEGAFQQSCDYESIRPPRRVFQCNWFFFAEKTYQLRNTLPCLHMAIKHFTDSKYYRGE